MYNLPCIIFHKQVLRYVVMTLMEWGGRQVCDIFCSLCLLVDVLSVFKIFFFFTSKEEASRNTLCRFGKCVRKP